MFKATQAGARFRHFNPGGTVMDPSFIIHYEPFINFSRDAILQ